MMDEVVRWSGVRRTEVRTAVDGCGVVCFALSVAAMARAYARFLHAADAGEAPLRIVDSMTSHPFAVAGTNRLCTDVMSHTQGRVWAKVGAEGVYGAGVRPSGLGMSLKAEDGGWRAGEMGLIALLEALEALDADVGGKLTARYGAVLNTRGDQVGSLEKWLALERPRHD